MAGRANLAERPGPVDDPETIAEIKPALLIETGTNRGGSALFYANLMDLLGVRRVMTMDVERLHRLQHSGSSFSTAAPPIRRSSSAFGPPLKPSMDR